MDKSGNVSYSVAHPKVLHKDRERVGKQIFSRIKKIKSNLKKCTLLDIGCSNGAISYYLSRYVKKAVGIDIDENAVYEGKKSFKRKNLVLKLTDGKKIPYPNNTFDIVIFRRTYQYVTYLPFLVKEIYRVLKPNGIVYFEGTNKLFPIEDDYYLPFLMLLPISVAIQYVKLYGYKDYYLGKYQTYWQLKNLFAEFKIISLTPEVLRSFLNLRIPLKLLGKLEPLSPIFVWILEKSSFLKVKN